MPDFPARRVLAVCTGGLALAAVAACDGASIGKRTTGGTPRPARAAAPAPPPLLPGPDGCVDGVPGLPAGAQRGMCFAHSWEDGGERGYGSEAARRSLGELRALGVDWISLTPFGYQRSLDDDRLQVPSWRAAETDERIRHAVRDARAAGLRVLLKPHVWIGGGHWVGHLDPGSDAAWERWWASYSAFAMHHARLAAELDVPLLSIGCELKSTTTRFPDRWRALIEGIRGVYRGELVYAANWDEVVDVTWWDALDYVGVQFYPPVADSVHTGDDAMKQRLQGYMDHLERVHEETDKPILFTEVGYRSRLHPELRPHAWPEHDGEDAPPPSEAAQARAYRRFFRSIEGRDWVAGVYWWKWFSNPASREEGPAGFSPRAKQAQAVLETAYAARCDGRSGAAR